MKRNFTEGEVRIHAAGETLAEVSVPEVQIVAEIQITRTTNRMIKMTLLTKNKDDHKSKTLPD